MNASFYRGDSVVYWTGYKENEVIPMRDMKDTERRPLPDAEADGIIEGRNAVIEALRVGTAIDKIYLAKGETDKTLGHIASKARDAGIVVVEADRRKLDGMSRTHAHQGVIALAAVREYAQHLIDQYDVRSGQGPVTIARSMSGGNQQKVIFGRWMLTNPDVLLLDDPTRGIDVGAKYEIYELIQSLAKQGKSIIMVSSEMPELLGTCNRILVMSAGQIAGEYVPTGDGKVDQEKILELASKNL